MRQSQPLQTRLMSERGYRRGTMRAGSTDTMYTWDLGAFIRWWSENIFFPKDNKEITNSRERWELARAEKLEFELGKMKGALLPRQDVMDALWNLVTVTKAAFQLVPDHAISAMVGMGPEDQRGGSARVGG